MAAEQNTTAPARPLAEVLLWAFTKKHQQPHHLSHLNKGCVDDPRLGATVWEAVGTEHSLGLALEVPQENLHAAYP